jgi:hypothetical protein
MLLYISILVLGYLATVFFAIALCRCSSRVNEPGVNADAETASVM